MALVFANVGDMATIGGKSPSNISNNESIEISNSSTCIQTPFSDQHPHKPVSKIFYPHHLSNCLKSKTLIFLYKVLGDVDKYSKSIRTHHNVPNKTTTQHVKRSLHAPPSSSRPSSNIPSIHDIQEAIDSLRKSLRQVTEIIFSENPYPELGKELEDMIFCSLQTLRNSSRLFSWLTLGKRDKFSFQRLLRDFHPSTDLSLMIISEKELDHETKVSKNLPLSNHTTKVNLEQLKKLKVLEMFHATGTNPEKLEQEINMYGWKSVYMRAIVRTKILINNSLLSLLLHPIQNPHSLGWKSSGSISFGDIVQLINYISKLFADIEKLKQPSAHKNDADNGFRTAFISIKKTFISLSSLHKTPDQEAILININTYVNDLHLFFEAQQISLAREKHVDTRLLDRLDLNSIESLKMMKSASFSDWNIYEQLKVFGWDSVSKDLVDYISKSLSELKHDIYHNFSHPSQDFTRSTFFLSEINSPEHQPSDANQTLLNNPISRKKYQTLMEEYTKFNRFIAINKQKQCDVKLKDRALEVFSLINQTFKFLKLQIRPVVTRPLIKKTTSQSHSISYPVGKSVSAPQTINHVSSTPKFKNIESLKSDIFSFLTGLSTKLSECGLQKDAAAIQNLQNLINILHKIINLIESAKVHQNYNSRKPGFLELSENLMKKCLLDVKQLCRKVSKTVDYLKLQNIRNKDTNRAQKESLQKLTNSSIGAIFIGYNHEINKLVLQNCIGNGWETDPIQEPSMWIAALASYEVELRSISAYMHEYAISNYQKTKINSTLKPFNITQNYAKIKSNPTKEEIKPSSSQLDDHPIDLDRTSGDALFLLDDGISPDSLKSSQYGLASDSPVSLDQSLQSENETASLENSKNFIRELRDNFLESPNKENLLNIVQQLRGLLDNELHPNSDANIADGLEDVQSTTKVPSESSIPDNLEKKIIDSLPQVCSEFFDSMAKSISKSSSSSSNSDPSTTSSESGASEIKSDSSNNSNTSSAASDLDLDLRRILHLNISYVSNLFDFEMKRNEHEESENGNAEMPLAGEFLKFAENLLEVLQKPDQPDSQNDTTVASPNHLGSDTGNVADLPSDLLNSDSEISEILLPIFSNQRKKLLSQLAVKLEKDEVDLDSIVYSPEWNTQLNQLYPKICTGLECPADEAYLQAPRLLNLFEKVLSELESNKSSDIARTDSHQSLFLHSDDKPQVSNEQQSAFPDESDIKLVSSTQPSLPLMSLTDNHDLSIHSSTLVHESEVLVPLPSKDAIDKEESTANENAGPESPIIISSDIQTFDNIIVEKPTESQLSELPPSQTLVLSHQSFEPSEALFDITIISDIKKSDDKLSEIILEAKPPTATPSNLTVESPDADTNLSLIDSQDHHLTLPLILIDNSTPTVQSFASLTVDPQDALKSSVQTDLINASVQNLSSNITLPSEKDSKKLKIEKMREILKNMESIKADLENVNNSSETIQTNFSTEIMESSTAELQKSFKKVVDLCQKINYSPPLLSEDQTQTIVDQLSSILTTQSIPDDSSVFTSLNDQISKIMKSMKEKLSLSLQNMIVESSFDDLN